MRFAVLKPLAAAGLALGLSACVTHTAMVPAGSYIDRVDVKLASSVTSPHLAETVQLKTRREALRYARTGAPKRLEISVTQLHYKNPALALLVGDSNNMSARVTVMDGATGASHGEFEANAIDTYAINGVVGAVVAIAQDKQDVDRRLAEKLAWAAMERVYGTAAAGEARKRTYDYIPEPQPAAAPASGPTPAAPPAATPKSTPKKPVPVASAKPDRTAMATAAAPAAR